MCVPIIHNMPQIVYTYHFEGSFCWSSIPFDRSNHTPNLGVWNPKTYPKFGIPKNSPNLGSGIQKNTANLGSGMGPGNWGLER